MYNYNARLYDPFLGKFISPDPIVPSPGNPQSLSRYAYVLNNPLNYVDPSGHSFFKKFFGKIFGGISAVITFFATGGNVYAAWKVFNIVDRVFSGAQAMYYGVPPGKIFGEIGMSVAVSNLNNLIPYPNFEKFDPLKREGCFFTENNPRESLGDKKMGLSWDEVGKFYG